MIPYLAVIGDSFRAAYASRVLWIAFVAIWILLAALAPIGFRQEYTTDFRSQDFYNGTRLKAMLAQGTVDESLVDQPLGRIASALPEELSRQLRRVGEGDEVRIFYRVFADALNACLDDESWYSKEAWSDTLQFRELRELDALEGPLEESIRRRRARLRIEAALPGVFEARSSQSIRLRYAGNDFPARFATDKSQFLTLVNQYVLPEIIQWLMGFVLVFLGILVTASMIPEMLQPGSLHLLLSKPVSRSLLLISKFFGGCTFVLLCVTQLVVGLFFIAWLRLDIWNPRLLWCIPVSVFLFAVFYSVSTLAGLIWRSSILAIGITCIFGSLCLVVGVIGGLFDSFVTRPDGVRNLQLAGQTLIGSTRGGGLSYWDEQEKVWSEIVEGNPLGMDRIIPPVALNESTVFTARIRGGRFNPFGSGASDLLVMKSESNWVGEPSLRLPTSTTDIFLSGDQLFALNAGELSAASIEEVLAEVSERSEAEEATDEEMNQLGENDENGQGSVANGWLQKLSTMMGGVTEGFSTVLPKNIALTPPRSLIVDPEGTYLVLYTRGRLIRFVPSNDADKLWSIESEKLVEGEVAKKSWLAISGDVILLVREDLPILAFDSKTLESRASLDMPDKLSPLLLEGMPDGRGFLFVASDGLVRRIQIKEGENDLQLLQPFGPDEIECILVDHKSDQAYIVHNVDSIDTYDLTEMKLMKRRSPSLSSWRFLDAYVISPLRFIVPQTGELGETIEAIISGESAKTILDGPDAGEIVRYQLLRPVMSCAMFILVMLITSCYYFATRDF